MLSIAIISKNEERHLPALFQSLEVLKKIANFQVVYVDTGSQDSSIQLAKEFGAEVHHFTWCHDFSAARNHAISKCKNRWILWLDADDQLPESSSQWLLTQLKDLDHKKVWLFEIDSPLPDGGHSCFSQVRLFPALAQIQFENPIHESLSPSIRRAGLFGAHSGCTILHRGYLDDAQNLAKAKRNQQLLEEQIKKDSCPASLIFSLARIYQIDSKLSEAESLLRRILKNPGSQLEQADVWKATWIYLGQCLGFQNRLLDSQKTFEEAQNQCPELLEHSQFLFEQAKIYFVLNQYAQAKVNLLRSIQLGPVPWSIPTDWSAIMSGAQQILSHLEKQFPETKMIPKVSIATIVKNEATNLSELGAQIQREQILHKNIQIEWIVVDTGSSDSSIRTAQQFGAKTFDFPWKGHFADARNHSLSHCQGEWILWLDADDRLPEMFMSHLLSLTTKDSKDAKDAKAWRLVIQNPRENGPGESFLQVRFFPNGKNICFAGRIHEELSRSLFTQKIPIENAPIHLHIQHMGYFSEQGRKEKARRNLPLLEKEAQENPDDATVFMEKGNTFVILGETENALSCYCQFLEKFFFPGTQNSILTYQLENLVNKLKGLKGHQANKVLENECLRHFPLLISELLPESHSYLLSWLELALDWLPTHPSPYYRLAKLAMAKENYSEAKKYFQDLLNLKPYVSIVASDTRTLRRNALGFSLLIKMGELQANENPTKDSEMESWIQELKQEKELPLPFDAQILTELEKWPRQELPPEKGSLVKNTLNPSPEKDHPNGVKNVGKQPKIADPDLDRPFPDLASIKARDLNGLLGKILSPLILPWKKDTLSVVMIVKNESANIEAAILSFRPFADEIVVNDTGSTDGTQEILTRLGVKWIQTQWEGDFSKARNAAIEEATCQWIFWLDADDRIPESEHDKYRKLKKAPPDRAFGIQLINTQAGQALGARAMQLRIFPNHPWLRFRNKVHEQIVYALAKAGLHLFYVDAIVHHTGYEEDAQQKAKAIRNLKILEEEAEHLLEDPSLALSKGDSFFILERWEEGIEAYRQLTLMPEIENINREALVEATANMGRGNQKLERYPEAIAWFEKALVMSPNKLEAHFYKAECFMAQGLRQEAKSTFAHIVSLPLSYTSSANQYDVINIYSRWNLGRLRFEDNEYASAKEVLLDLTERYAQVIEPWVLLGRCEIKLGNKETALKFWKSALEKGPKAIPNLAKEIEDLEQELKAPKVSLESPSSPSSNLLISLCMIVKNESKRIKNCLDSIAPHVDEIIIVDTGSDDGTQSIASSLGARVIQDKWEKDFSKARNLSLQQAKGRWILWLDADDIVPPQSGSALRELSLQSEKSGQAKAFGFMIKNSTDQGKSGTVFNQIRLFPNRPTLRFCNPVHEQILPAIEKEQLPVDYSTVIIWHTGYDSPEALKSKQIRNKEILELQVKNGMDVTPVTYFTLGNAILDLGEFESSIPFFKQAKNLAEKQKNNPHIAESVPNKIAICYTAMQKPNQGLVELSPYMESQNLSQYSSERILIRAQIEEALGHDELAREFYETLLGRKEEPVFIPVDISQCKIQAVRFLGNYWQKRGNMPLAIEILKRGLSLSQGKDLTHADLLSLYQSLM